MLGQELCSCVMGLENTIYSLSCWVTVGFILVADGSRELLRNRSRGHLILSDFCRQISSISAVFYSAGTQLLLTA